MKFLTLASVLLLSFGYATSESGYVEVRPGAHMFWWLMKSGEDFRSKPLVIWLQGGPGGSGTGFGNFAEIGPRNEDLTPRNNTWLKYANLLFIDNPVGTGYSYVESDDLFTTNNTQIAQDLVVMFKSFLKSQPNFQLIPLIVFSESYGGKMASTFGVHLWKAIQTGEIEANFKGVALGDSWISPIDSTASWSDYLLSVSLIDYNEKRDLDQRVAQIRTELKKGNGAKATGLWEGLQNYVSEYTGGINWYNIMSKEGPEAQMSNFIAKNKYAKQPYSEATYRLVHYLHEFKSLDDLMNGPIKKELGIPRHVTWGGQSNKVFSSLAEDFMKPVINDVAYLLDHTDVKVAVYTGQLDLIVDTLGTEVWLNGMNWKGNDAYRRAKRELLSGEIGSPKAFVKKYGNLSFYWILNAGHMIPSDQLDVSVEMLNDVIKDNTETY